MAKTLALDVEADSCLDSTRDCVGLHRWRLSVRYEWISEHVPCERGDAADRGFSDFPDFMFASSTGCIGHGNSKDDAMSINYLKAFKDVQLCIIFIDNPAVRAFAPELLRALDMA